jgi:hypothetical protein
LPTEELTTKPTLGPASSVSGAPGLCSSCTTTHACEDRAPRLTVRRKSSERRNRWRAASTAVRP